MNTKRSKNNRLSRLWRTVLSVACALVLLPGAGLAYADDAAQTPQWEVSKSKTATNLDDNLESQVTLSLPSSEEQLVSDVVLVLDKSTSGTETQTKALQMLQDLQAQVANTNAKVNVGVVIFNNKANVANDGNFYDLATQYSDIEAAVGQTLHSGTNSHAGLIAGEQMLDGDTSVAASRKYLIFVSDGITYIYNEKPTCTAWSYRDKMDPNYWKSAYIWQEEYGSASYVPGDWGTWLTAIGTKVANQGTQYEFDYSQPIPADQPTNDWQQKDSYASSPDVALYKTYMEYQAIAKKYHAYALPVGTTTELAWGPSFVQYLAGGQTVSFDQIKNDISYLVDKGSYVDDYMGYADGDYDFDFVNSADKLTLKVGDETLAAEAAGENTYGFGKADDGTYRYLLEYVPGDKKADEHFRLTISVPVSNFAPVQLTYSVKLTNSKTAAGTYGTYDADGSKGYDGLYTNSRAVLHPVSSDGTALAAEEFGKPTVSYTVKKSAEPATPDKPTDEPTKPTTPTKPSTPAQPAKSATVKKTSARPLPATGDPSVNVAGFAIAGAACAIVAVVLRCRKANK